MNIKYLIYTLFIQNVIMSKLLHIGIRGVMQSWFKSYLSNRKQYVSVKNSNSSMSNITLGVPQGNVHATVKMELAGVDNWLKTNRLSLNVSKTSYMKIYNQENELDIKIRLSILTKASIVKFIGKSYF